MFEQPPILDVRIFYPGDVAQLPRGRYLLASLTGNLEGSIELMVLRERH